jgi:hypothetical protein
MNNVKIVAVSLRLKLPHLNWFQTSISDLSRFYVAATREATDGLVDKRYLLAEDAARLLAEAEREGIRSAP